VGSVPLVINGEFNEFYHHELKEEIGTITWPGVRSERPTDLKQVCKEECKPIII